MKNLLLNACAALFLPLFGLSGCAQAAPPSAEHLVVATVRVGTRDAASTFRASGDVHAEVESNLAFRVSGKLVQRLVDIGDHVEAGALIARLDAEQARADVAAAQGALASVSATLERVNLELTRDRSLFARAVIAKAALDASERDAAARTSEVQAARARLDLAREAVGYAELRAGHAGVITARAVEVGQTVQPGVTVFALANDGTRDAVFRVPETIANRLGTQSAFTVELVDQPGVRVDGHLREISPGVDPATGTVRIKVTLDHPPPQMALGSPVVASLALTTTKVFTVPAAAIVSDTQQAPSVWVVDEATRAVKLRRIDVATYESRNVVVRSGLADGELVVTDGASHLRPSQVVALAKGDRS